MKRCGTCKEEIPIESFGKDKRAKDGLSYRCKPCDRKWTAGWRQNNREAHRKMSREYAQTHVEQAAVNSAKYNKNNRDIRTAAESLRRANKLQATPGWFNVEEVNCIYSLAKGRSLVVDHIVPLKSKYVCGLHVQDNLRCIPSKLNLHKSNRYWPNMATGGY